MTAYRRFAVYYAPPARSELARFGASWLGWDAGAGSVAVHPEVPLDVAAITRTPRKYGFHGTLKPPFKLAGGSTEAALSDAVSALAGSICPFDIAPLALRPIGRFIALVPSRASDALADLAAACVQRLDPFRAPLTEADRAKRRRNGLSARQEMHLEAWGYPYVLEEFRFHLTLSGPLDTETAGRVLGVLHPLVAPHVTDPVPVRDVAMFGERADGRFEIIRRYPLTG
ncbi:MAG: DUF1045 domain-containing protein [Pseudomonadota bacterium]